MAVTTDVSTTGQDDYSYGAVIQPDGKIVLGGVSGAGDCALVRYTANGGLDTSFGTGGIVSLTTSTAGAVTEASRVAIPPDGKLLLAGRYYDGDSITEEFASSPSNTIIPLGVV